MDGYWCWRKGRWTFGPRFKVTRYRFLKEFNPPCLQKGSPFGATLKELGYRKVFVLKNGVAAWRSAGLPVEMGLTGVMVPPNDLVSLSTDRNWAEAIDYLRWEKELGHKYQAPSGKT